jgi:hypothetical protein
MLPEAYAQGREAAFDDRPEDGNPYPVGSAEYEQWLEGYRDAMHELYGCQ